MKSEFVAQIARAETVRVNKIIFSCQQLQSSLHQYTYPGAASGEALFSEQLTICKRDGLKRVFDLRKDSITVSDVDMMQQGNIFFFYKPWLSGEALLVGRALHWSGNPYGNGYGVEMDGNGAQFVKMFWIDLDLGQGHQLETIR